VNDYTYLALGDSIAFGYDPTVVPIPPAILPKPSQYTGYPEIVAGIEDPFTANQQVNAACPGETSSSFLSGMPPDNGCNGPAGFKAIIGLHASYTSYKESQMAFALSQLSANKQIKVVTLGIGGDDLQLLELACQGPTAPNFTTCVAGALPGVLSTYGTNLYLILSQLRTAGYNGKIILVKYYSPNANPLFIAAIGELNSVMVTVGSPFGAKFADAFTAFQIASEPSGGDPCKAGLLIRLSSTTCDVHPSPAGRDLIAATVIVAQFE
jgi:lysophospholipase L1-like esterase